MTPRRSPAPRPSPSAASCWRSAAPTPTPGVIAGRLATLGIDVVARSIVGDHLHAPRARRPHGAAAGRRRAAHRRTRPDRRRPDAAGGGGGARARAARGCRADGAHRRAVRPPWPADARDQPAPGDAHRRRRAPRQPERHRAGAMDRRSAPRPSRCCRARRARWCRCSRRSSPGRSAPAPAAQRTYSRGLQGGGPQRVVGRSHSAAAVCRLARRVAAHRRDDPGGAGPHRAAPVRARRPIADAAARALDAAIAAGGRGARARRCTPPPTRSLEELAGDACCTTRAGAWPSPSRAPAACSGARLTDVPGSSAWVEGGVVTYSNALKTALADVPPALIAEHGAVSEPVAPAAGRRRARALRRARSASASPASPVPTAAPRPSRSAPCSSRSHTPDGRGLPACPFRRRPRRGAPAVGVGGPRHAAPRRSPGTTRRTDAMSAQPWTCAGRRRRIPARLDSVPASADAATGHRPAHRRIGQRRRGQRAARLLAGDGADGAGPRRHQGQASPCGWPRR